MNFLAIKANIILLLIANRLIPFALIMNLFSRTLAVLLAVIAVLFITSAAKVESATKCQVCHNGKNPHTLDIPCKNVQKYLNDHPGDTPGPCQGVTDEKPAKPAQPNPKP